jgi:hypothetical protein
MKKILCFVTLGIFVLFSSVDTAKAQNGGGVFEIGPVMNRTRIVPMSATMNDGRVVLFGGRENGFVSSSYADIYDPGLNSFTEVSMNNPHDGTCVIKLDDGRYFILGGSENLGVAPGYAVTEIYDPTDNSFTPSTSMLYQRMQHNGTQLADGKILIAGAWYNNQGAATGEVIDLNAGSSVPTGAMVTPRAAAMVLPTEDGNAVVFGGYTTYGASMITTVEEYDHVNNTFVTLSNEIIPGEPEWITYNGMHNGPSSEYQLSDGRYAFLIYRYAPALEYAIAIFDPADKSFIRFETTAPIFDDVVNTAVYDAVVDKDHDRMYLLGAGAGSSPAQVGIIGVDLTNGNTQHPTALYSLASDEYLFPTMAFIPQNGKILLTGISSTSGDYFHATNKTYLITPDAILSVQTMDMESTMALYPNPAMDHTMLSFNATFNAPARLQIVDAAGRIVRSENKTIVTGAQQWQISLSDLEAGFYFVEVIAESADAQRVLHQRFSKSLIVR